MSFNNVNQVEPSLFIPPHKIIGLRFETCLRPSVASEHLFIGENGGCIVPPNWSSGSARTFGSFASDRKLKLLQDWSHPLTCLNYPPVALLGVDFREEVNSKVVNSWEENTSLLSRKSWSITSWLRVS